MCVLFVGSNSSWLAVVKQRSCAVVLSRARTMVDGHESSERKTHAIHVYVDTGGAEYAVLSSFVSYKADRE
jgi:hypothetical protein